MPRNDKTTAAEADVMFILLSIALIIVLLSPALVQLGGILVLVLAVFVGLALIVVDLIGPVCLVLAVMEARRKVRGDGAS